MTIRGTEVKIEGVTRREAVVLMKGEVRNAELKTVVAGAGMTGGARIEETMTDGQALTEEMNEGAEKDRGPKDAAARIRGEVLWTVAKIRDGALWTATRLGSSVGPAVVLETGPRRRTDAWPTGNGMRRAEMLVIQVN